MLKEGVIIKLILKKKPIVCLAAGYIHVAENEGC